MGKPKPAVTPTVSKKAVAKTAQRARVAERRQPCPYCGEGLGFAISVLFVPDPGRPVNARGCSRCGRVWDHKAGTLLAEGVRL